MGDPGASGLEARLLKVGTETKAVVAAMARWPQSRPGDRQVRSPPRLRMCEDEGAELIAEQAASWVGPANCGPPRLVWNHGGPDRTHGEGPEMS